jgi:hypothetical protein
MTSLNKKSLHTLTSFSNTLNSRSTLNLDVEDTTTIGEFDSECGSSTSLTTKILDFKELVNTTPFERKKGRSLSYNSKPVNKAPCKQLKAKDGREISREDFSPSWLSPNKKKSRFFYECEGTSKGCIISMQSCMDNHIDGRLKIQKSASQPV